MDYIAVGLFTFFIGMATMSLFAMRGADEQAREFREARKALKAENDSLEEENDEQYATIKRLEARLDGRTVTLYDETGMAVEMPVEEVA